MRIAIDVRELEKDKETGIGRFILNFLNFIDLHDKQNQYVLFGNQNTRKLNFSSQIKLRIIPEFCGIFWEQIVLWREIKRDKIDILFSPFYKGCLLSRAKLIVACYDLYFLKSSRNPVSNWLKRFYFLLTGKRAAVIITISQYSREQIINFLSCSSQKVRVVLGNVEERFKPLDKIESFNNLANKFPKLKKDFILYVGNLTENKNLAGLIKAYSLLPDTLKDRFQLVVVGKKDKNYPFLLRLTEQGRLIDKVQFLGLVSEEELLLLYNAASALALVSFCEGFGLPALEAMACAKPVVVSNTSSLPEVVGDAGLYVNPQDIDDIKINLEKILTDEELRKDLSAKALLQSEKFKVGYSANKILEIFEELNNAK